MKSKLYLIIFLAITSGMPMPAQAGIWDSLRNSTLMSYVFGKPVEVNYTAQTRLPVIEAQQSFWSRITNFFAWRNFRTAQPAPAPAPQPAHQEPILPRLSPEAAENFVARLDAMREAHEAKKLAELSKLAQERESEAKNTRDLQVNTKNEFLERIKSALEAQRSLHDKLIESKQEELSGLAEQKKIAESENAHLKETAGKTTEKHINELALLQGQLASLENFSSGLNREQLAKAHAEKESLKSQIDRLQKENTDYLHDKHSIATLLREKQLAAETAEQKANEKIQRLDQQITQFKRALEAEGIAKTESQEEARRIKTSLTRLEANFNTAVSEKESLFQEVAVLRTHKDHLILEQRALESKTTAELRKLRAELDSEKKTHEQARKELENSRQQSSKALSSSLELNRQFEAKDKEIVAFKQSLAKKQNDLELLIAKFERNEKEKEEEKQAVANLFSEIKKVDAQTAKFDGFIKSVNDKLTVMNGKLSKNNGLITHIQANLPSKTKPQLPVIMDQTQAIEDWFSNFDRQLTEWEEKRKASAHADASQKMAINQSNLPVQENLNDSVIGNLANSFTELSRTPSPTSPEAGASSPKIKFQDSMYSKIGLENIKKIMNNDHIESMPQAEYMHAIIGLAWHLYDHANHKKEKFEEGTFVIEDRGFKIYNFLMKYTQLVNTTITGTTADPLSHYSDNPFAYSRDASHFVEQKKKYRPYGIDIRFGKYGKEKAELPADKKHLLFGICNFEKELIYIKPENHGLYYQDGLLGHIAEFASAQARKDNRIANAFRTFFGWFGFKIGTDDGESFRKERIPKEFLLTFALNLKAASFSGEQKQAFMEQAKKSGLKTLCNPDIIQSPVFKDMIAKYHEEYDNLPDRTGREVFLSHDELQRAITR